MRRLLLPLVVFAVMVAAIILAVRADNAADPDDPGAVAPDDSLTTPVLSVRRAPEWLRRPTADGRLEVEAGRVLESIGPEESACLRVHRGGVPLVENGQGIGLTPGETQRLLTIAALDLGAADTGFTTRVVRSSADPVADGTLTGDIWLIGGGDPVLSTQEYIGRFDDDRAHTSLEELAIEVAGALAAEGITRIEGRVVGDESLYPIERDYEADGTWTSTDNDDNHVGPLSALLVNDGFLAPFPEVPDAAANRRASNPATAGAEAFRALLQIGGITVTGSATTGNRPPAAEQVELGSIQSPPLEALAARAMVDATTAEMLLKAIGLRTGTGAERDQAVVGMFFTLGDAELPTASGVLPFDGSGLSARNVATCDLLVAVLDLGAEASMVGSVLPEITDTALAACAPPTDGTLKVHGAARGPLTSLAGSYAAANGDIVTFALITNRTAGRGVESFAPCNPLQATLLAAVAGHPYGPDLDELSPLPVVASGSAGTDGS